MPYYHPSGKKSTALLETRRPGKRSFAPLRMTGRAERTPAFLIIRRMDTHRREPQATPLQKRRNVESSYVGAGALAGPPISTSSAPVGAPSPQGEGRTRKRTFAALRMTEEKWTSAKSKKKGASGGNMVPSRKSRRRQPINRLPQKSARFEILRFTLRRQIACHPEELCDEGS